MKYILRHKTLIERRLKRGYPVLLLDFDLTLSPLAQNPMHARLPSPTKSLLLRLAEAMPVAIISGRKLSDVKKRIGIKNMIYVGNHGLEHNLGPGTAVSAASRKILLEAKKRLLRECKKYPGVVFEDKKYSFALGYRLIKPEDVRPLANFLKKFKRELEKDRHFAARLDKKTFEIMPAGGENKGTAVRLVLKGIQKNSKKKYLPIYVGDGKTDEDAFLALRKTGITVRVGKSKKTAAKWYLRNQKEVDLFLKWMIQSFVL